MTHDTGNYVQACRRAATAQGLDPIVAALADAEIVSECVQTGGFCMVVEVRNERTGRHVWITVDENGPLEDDDEPDEYLVVQYNDTDADGCEGDEIIAGAVESRMVAAVRAFLSEG